jgi:hypothetical protein
MAAITPTTERLPVQAGQAVSRVYGTGAANSADTLTAVNDGQTRRLTSVVVKYSAAPTQAGVTITHNQGIGAGFDALLTTGSADALTTVYIPDGDYWVPANDSIDVAAPAGGAGITAAVVVTFEGK